MGSSSTVIRRAIQTVVALALFFVVSALYFSPQFSAQTLPQGDLLQFQGMSKDIADQRAATGEDPQWTGGMFGGMPAYLINVAYPAQAVKGTVGQIVKLLNTPASFMFFAMVAMWLMMLMFRVDGWVGIIPALAYGLSTYFLLIIGAGHITKLWAMVYAPLMMGGAWMTLKGNMWFGAVITALAASLELGANHPQITYYFLLAMAILWLVEGVAAIREKYLKKFATRTALLVAAGVLAVGSNFSPLWYASQSGKETVRGGSELASDSQAGNKGLDLQYATAWSYGRSELLNLLVPDFMGSDGQTFATDGEVAAALNDYGLQGTMAKSMPTYWGPQPFTEGPTYIGAAVLFLAVLGITLTGRRNRWWLIATCILMIFLALGNHFMGFTKLAFNYLPGYNKFRTVSMALVVVQWAAPLLAAFALMRLWRDRDTIPRSKLLRALGWAAGITGGICLVLAVGGRSMFDFGRAASTREMTGQFYQIFTANNMQDYIDKGMDVEIGTSLGNAMAAERASMMSSDAWRSLLMVLLAAGGVLLFAFRKTGKTGFVSIVGAIVLLDLTPVDLRFLSHDDFVSPRHVQISATAADRTILADTTLGFRVINLTVSPFNDATTSYFHRSVGGYHGAKLARYQDLIDRYLGKGDAGVLDMLDTRYAIVPDSAGQPRAVFRPTANGAAWFVDRIDAVKTPQEEIDALGKVDLKTTAVVADDESVPAADTTAARSIELTEYRPNYLKYSYSSPVDAVAVFSEIYYKAGWRAFIDGKEAPYFRADYVLRAMQLPAGQHDVVWKFRAPHWQAVEGVTLAASLVILLGALAALVYYLLRKNKDKSSFSKGDSEDLSK